MLIKWLTFSLFSAPKKELFSKISKNEKLVELMLLKDV